VTEILGLSPKYLFGLSCFSAVLSVDQEDVLRDNIDFMPDSESGRGGVEEEGPQVFLLTGSGMPGQDLDGATRQWKCWVAAHRPKQPTDRMDENGQALDPSDLIILEFELERDTFNPLGTLSEDEQDDTPDGSVGRSPPVDSGGKPLSGGASAKSEGSRDSNTTIGSTAHTPMARNSNGSSTQHATSNTSMQTRRRQAHVMGLAGVEQEHPLERILESTTNYAKPLRALERMRRTGNEPNSRRVSRPGARPMPRRRLPAGSAGTLDIFAVLGQINDQLGAAPDLETFLKITVGVVQDLSRFHRVVIYQFDEHYNGQVVSELVEWGKTNDLFKGLMFPAADIPAQARELYKINKVRLLYDRSQTTARMVLRSKADLEVPLDMTHCYLRAMSPIHIKCRSSLRAG
jgi:hypothetical protein